MSLTETQAGVGFAVAVVDDDPAVRTSLKFSLEVEGFRVRVFPGAAEVLQEPDLPKCACILIDYNMPGMSGLELLARLRERQVNVPAIFITGKPDAAMRERAAAVGVPVVEKPFLDNVLMDVIHKALAHAGNGRPR